MAEDALGALSSRDLRGLGMDSGLDMFATRGHQDFLVTLPTEPNTPFEISHTLTPALPTGVRYELLQSTFPTILYHDPIADLWTGDYVVLRATSGDGAQVRIRLTVDDADASPIDGTANPDPIGFSVPGRFVSGDAEMGFLGESAITDGSTGYGMRFGSAALYYRNDGADKYIKLSMDGRTPVQVRHTGSSFFLQPGPLSNALEPINLGSPLESSSRGWFENGYIYYHYERGRTTPMGEWIPVAHSAGNFTASAGSWTVAAGDQATYAYMLVGKTMWLSFSLNTTSTSAACVLRLAIPGGYVVAKYMESLYRANDGGAGTTSMARVLNGGTYVELYFGTDGGNFGIRADILYVNGMICFEVQ